jgi:hypothetical protein
VHTWQGRPHADRTQITFRFRDNPSPSLRLAPNDAIRTLSKAAVQRMRGGAATAEGAPAGRRARTRDGQSFRSIPIRSSFFPPSSACVPSLPFPSCALAALRCAAVVCAAGLATARQRQRQRRPHHTNQRATGNKETTHATHRRTGGGRGGGEKTRERRRNLKARRDLHGLWLWLVQPRFCVSSPTPFTSSGGVSHRRVLRACERIVHDYHHTRSPPPRA